MNEDVVSALRYSLPMALVAGTVWYLVSSLTREPDFVDGAVFMVVFGVVVTLGWFYSSDRKN
ncbi:hypothetical protein ACFQJC_04645 [Haloferax namakaokahaiae]|uniref:Uncharacterized protein n=1 Tax=Haloferax namakaokahaiae TaxID=1748331 RepID=A0ABD5ZBY1_9EURY